MKTNTFKSRSCHTCDDRVRNPRICNTYEKHRGGGLPLVQTGHIPDSWRRFGMAFVALVFRPAAFGRLCRSEERRYIHIALHVSAGKGV